jgi:biopolymer transport protein ExbD
MPWRFRREGAAQERGDLSLEQITAGLRDGKIEPTDEVLGPGETAWVAIENHPALAEIAEEIDAPLPRIHDEPTTLDMNPLIDVCLVLLVFFILTTSYAVAVVKVIPLDSVQSNKKGVAVVTTKQVKEQMVSVEMFKKNGKLVVRVEGQTPDVLAADGTIDGSKLEAVLRPYSDPSRKDRKTQMLLDARDVDWGTVVSLQDHAKDAGILTVTHRLR